MRSTIHAILALDQAGTSGVAFGRLIMGTVFRSVTLGTTLRRAHRLEVMQAVQGLVGTIANLAVIFEDHSGIPASSGWGTPTLLGMGDARGRWHELLDSLGHPEDMRFEVDMRTWRGAVLGPEFVKAKTDVVKAEAVRVAEAMYRLPDLDHNAAEAGCILEWARRNAATWFALPPKPAKKPRKPGPFKRRRFSKRRAA